MTEIHLLEELVAFAQTGTLSAAAEQLHTSQPALTRSMKKLEDDLDVKLFIRGKNRLEFNETGKLAARYAERVLNEDSYFEEKVKSFDRSLHTINIGYCAPVPQSVFTPLINSVFEGMTISADMGDDKDYLNKLRSRTYQLAVTHLPAEGDEFYCVKCGHEDLFLSLDPSDPLTFYPELHMKDVDGRSILLMNHIGFWKDWTHSKTPNTHYLVQRDRPSFNELAENSKFPCFASSYFLSRGQGVPGRIAVKLADPECHTDFFLVCLKSEKERFRELFKNVNEKTIS